MLSIFIFVGFDVSILISSQISTTWNWLCWLYFLWIHSAKIIRCEIDRRKTANWVNRTNNVTEAVGAVIGFVLLLTPWKGRLDSFILSFVLAYLVGTLSATLENHAKINNSTLKNVQRLVYLRNDEAKCVIYQGYLYVGDTYLQLPCHHVLHDNCGRDWFACKVECPICQATCK